VPGPILFLSTFCNPTDRMTFDIAERGTAVLAVEGGGRGWGRRERGDPGRGVNGEGTEGGKGELG
jgi:hypothetical protein